VKRVLDHHNDIFGPWICQQLGTKWINGRGEVIGLWDDDKGPIAACLYESCNGRSIIGHLAGLGRKWMNREFLWYCFYYPFEQLGVDKILGIVESSNIAAQKLDEHLGFTLEATLKDAAPNGDLLIYSMTKDQCKWLNLTEAYRGQTLSTCTS
jgi:RimJ/RimL family protein N-acetyltransferase